MYSLIEYSLNYFQKAGILWFYSKDEANNFNADIANDNIMILNLLNIRLDYIRQQ